MWNPLRRVTLLGLSLLTALQVPSVLCAGASPLPHGQHFMIENASDASDQELQALLPILERAYTDVARVLGKTPPVSIRVVVREGEGIPSARGRRLWFYRVGGRIQAEAAAHELVHLTTGYTSSPPIEEGLAVYVAETLAPHERRLFPQFGQPVDAWAVLFRQQGTLLPLARVLGTTDFHWDLRGSPEDAQGWQTYLEAGSFVRWLVELRGWEVLWRLHQTLGVQATLGAPVAEVEHAWLESVGRRGITPTPCRALLPQSLPRFLVWCEQVDPFGAAPPGVERPQTP